MWLSQAVKDNEHVIVDTAREPGALLPYMQPGEVVPADTLLVVVNIQTMRRLQEVWLEQTCRFEPWRLMHDPNGAEIAFALIAIECKKQPGLARELRLE